MVIGEWFPVISSSIMGDRSDDVSPTGAAVCQVEAFRRALQRTSETIRRKEGDAHTGGSRRFTRWRYLEFILRFESVSGR